MKSYILIGFGILLLSIGYINTNRYSDNYNHAENLIHDFIIQSEMYKKDIKTYIDDRKNTSDSQLTERLTENIRGERQSIRSQLFLLLNNPYIKNNPALKGIILRHVVESNMLTAGSYNIGSDGLNFDRADARGINFNNTRLIGVNLNGVNLKGAVLRKVNVRNSDLRNIVYDRTTRWGEGVFNSSTQFSEDFNPIQLGFIEE